MRFALTLVGVLVGPAPGAEEASGGSAAAPPAFAFDDTLFLSLRVHVLEARGLDGVDCEIGDAEIERRVRGADRIWRQAGIRVSIESIVREEAAGRERFEERLDAGGRAPLDAYQLLIPAATRAPDALDVYVVAELPVNGVFFGGRRAVFVKTAPRLRPVAGGTDYPPERVLAHEIGHFFGLRHAGDVHRLLASGTTGCVLDATEVRAARDAAARRPEVKSAGALLDAADRALAGGDRDGARRRLEALGVVPEGSPLKARAARLRGRAGEWF